MASRNSLGGAAMQQHRQRFCVWLIAALFIAGTLEAADKLVIISPHWEGFRSEYGRAFSAWHAARYGTPVELDWRDVGGASDDLRFVISEFEQRPAGIGLDLFFGGGMDPYYELQKRGLLEQYRPPDEVLAGIPKAIGGVPVYDPEFRWFGVAIAGFGIVYNKRVLELNHWPAVATWRELAERAPVGSVGSGDPRNSGSVHMMYELILQRYGWDEGWKIITQLAAKIRHFDRSGSAAPKEVVVGNVAYALAIDFYGLTQIAYAGKENVGFVLPQDCVVVNPDGIALLRGAPHRPVAQRFIDFALSEAGQKLLKVPRGQPGGAQRFNIERMSVRPALYEQYRDVTLVPINPFAVPMSFTYDPKRGSARWAILNGLLGSLIIDVHEELVAAWRRQPKDLDRFCAMPVTEAEALALAAGKWRDPLFRARTTIEWQRWAQQKFQEIR
jgi:ABC-type Fe3+ transport system substrate-binding protein